MNCPSIDYKKRKGRYERYKYELTKDWECSFQRHSFSISKCHSSQFIKFGLANGSKEDADNNSDYCLRILKGYAWDGLSGPTVDTHSSMRGSLVHDALYQLMREPCLDCNKDRKEADNILYDFCRQDGMMWLYAQSIYWGVRMFGEKYACPPKEYKSPSNESSKPDGKGNDEESGER